MRKRRWFGTGAILILALLLGQESFREERQQVREESQRHQEAMEKAKTDPTSPYPDTVTYTLAKMIGADRSAMPAGDTYEDNAYTRYLREKLNVQNEDVIEVAQDDNYDLFVERLVIEGEMPDVMLVSNLDYLKTLVEQELVEDLTDAYAQCTSQRIKEIYESYGSGLMNSVTFDGKIMAIPSTQVYAGSGLFWVREDWREELNLPKPTTLADVEEIVLAFREHQMGGAGNIGLPALANLVAQESYNYSLDPVFGAFDAYPQIWLKQDGTYVYGSSTRETKEALAFLRDWYAKGVLDEDYMMRTPTEIGNLIRDGKCGAFFGWWWAPNNPLMEAVRQDASAEWKPYLITNDEGEVHSYLSAQSTRYVVVRKGYEYPELIMKIITALFDDARFLGDSTEEMDAYQKNGVDITARPLVINCDYAQAVFDTTKNIRLALDREKTEEDLSSLEQVYYRVCSQYLAGERTPDLWASYASRLEAVELLMQDHIQYVNAEYVQETNFAVDTDQRTEEILDFMKIITGEEPIIYFDLRKEAWKKNMFLENVS